MEHNRKKIRVAWLSVASNTTLVLMKLVVGIVMGSVSVISEAIHSSVDLLAAIIALLAVKAAGKPADKEHPFGHGKAENISGTIEALLIFLAAVWIIYEAVHKIISPAPITALGLGVAVMFISSLANAFVSVRLLKISKETESVALKADAWHLLTDIYTSAGVMVALLIIWVGEKLFPEINFLWLDPIVAIGVALLILRAAYKLTVESARDLMDVSLPRREEETIQKAIKGFFPAVKGYHHLRTRKAGSSRFIEFHMLVDPLMSVVDSHSLADELTGKLKSLFSDSHVTIHIEPCDGKCTSHCIDGCLLTNDERDKKKKIG